jgi:beta-carotene 3-hydroxylase
MTTIYFVLTMGFTFFMMEGITWLTHKYIMHGLLWFLHEDHHKKTSGVFEKNDTFFLIFSIPSILCIAFGVTGHIYWLVAIGLGIALYGLAYFVVHDIIIHQRIRLFSRSNNEYVKAIRWAHKMHHKHLEKEKGESFGMLIVARKYWLKARSDNQAASKKSQVIA